MRHWLAVALVCLALTISLFAGPRGMMLYGDYATVNGAKMPMPSMAVFPDDIVRTKKSPARLAYSGANVALDQNTAVTLGPDFVRLDHGSLLVVDTNAPVAVHAGDLLIVPVNQNPTQFEIKDENHKVQIMAKKGDLLIKDCNGSTTLPEGQLGTRDDASKCKKGAPPGAKGPILDSKAAKVTGGLVGAGLIIWATQGGGDSNQPTPASPVQP